MNNKESVWEELSTLRTASFSTIQMEVDQYGSVKISILEPTGDGVYTIVQAEEMGILLTSLGNSMSQAFRKREERAQVRTLEHYKNKRN